MESALRWRRLDDRTVGDAVARSGAGPALGVPDGQLAAAVLDAGRQASERLAAAPARSAGSCYFPETGGA
jgi:lipoate-protein ligase A